MKPSERSIFAFGCYLLGLGAAVLLAPNLVLSIFGVPPTQEVWIRIVGMLLLFIGIVDLVAARAHLEPYIRLSVPLRASVVLFFGAFVALQLATPVLMLFAAIDLAAAAWTAVALRAESPRASVATA